MFTCSAYVCSVSEQWLGVDGKRGGVCRQARWVVARADLDHPALRRLAPPLGNGVLAEADLEL